MQSGFETLGGRPFFLRRWGDPALPRLLMLHGFPEYGGAWAELAERLCHRFHCIAPDQRGFGQSWAPQGTEHYTTSRLVGDMVDLIAKEGQTVTVLGHDWGSAVAYGLAMFQPRLVRRLVVANGVHPVPFQRALAQGGPQSAASQYILWLRQEQSAEALRKNDFEKLLALFATEMDMSWLSGALLDSYKQEWARPGRLHSMTDWYRASPIEVAKPGQPIPMPALPVERLKVPQPHLLIWGADDTALLPESTKGLEDFAPDLTRVSLAGCDHWLHHQKPQEFADALLDWHP